MTSPSSDTPASSSPLLHPPKAPITSKATISFPPPSIIGSTPGPLLPWSWLTLIVSRHHRLESADAPPPVMADSDLAGFGFDPRAMRYPYSPRISWPAPTHHIDPSPQRQNIGANASAVKRSTTPLQSQRSTIQPMAQPMAQPCQLRPHHPGHEEAFSRATDQQIGIPPQIQSQNHLQFDQQPSQQQIYPIQYRNHSQAYNHTMNSHQTMPTDNQHNAPDWSYQQQNTASQPFPVNTNFAQQYSNQAYMPYGSSPVSFLSEQNQYGSNVSSSDGSYLSLNSDIDMEAVPFTLGADFSNALINYPGAHGLPDMSIANQVLPNSPTDTSLEVRSLSSSDNGWASIEYPQGFDGSYSDNQAIFNPSQTLHCRTLSDSSFSDIDNQRLPWGDYVEVPPHAIGSPSTDSAGDRELLHEAPDFHDEMPIKHEKPTSPILSSSTTAPIKIKTPKSPQRSPIASRRTSPPGRRPPRKNSGKTTKAITKRQPPPVKVDTEKRIGRRRGPLRPEQRKQACEIRKLGACLRCKFLKKTVSKSKHMLCLPLTSW